MLMKWSNCIHCFHLSIFLPGALGTQGTPLLSLDFLIFARFYLPDVCSVDSRQAIQTESLVPETVPFCVLIPMAMVYPP